MKCLKIWLRLFERRIDLERGLETVLDVPAKALRESMTVKAREVEHVWGRTISESTLSETPTDENRDCRRTPSLGACGPVYVRLCRIGLRDKFSRLTVAFVWG